MSLSVSICGTSYCVPLLPEPSGPRRFTGIVVQLPGFGSVLWIDVWAGLHTATDYEPEQAPAERGQPIWRRSGSGGSGADSWDSCTSRTWQWQNSHLMNTHWGPLSVERVQALLCIYRLKTGAFLSLNIQYFSNLSYITECRIREVH